MMSKAAIKKKIIVFLYNAKIRDIFISQYGLDKYNQETNSKLTLDILKQRRKKEKKIKTKAKKLRLII